MFVNAPTVQELLHDCAREVRSIMWDVTFLDGPALAAAWPVFAAHAGEALAAVPCPDPGARLLAGRMAGPRPRPTRWGRPVEADPDPHLVAASEALAAVAALLGRHATPPTSARAARDGDLARWRIAESVFIASHGVALGLHEHATRLRSALPDVAFEQPGVKLAVAGASLVLSRRLASDLDSLQAHLAHYLAGTPGLAPRRDAAHVVERDRLPHVLAAWEVAAMRLLHASPPSVRDLAGAAHAEQALLMHTMVILDAAAGSGVIDRGGFTAQIRPRLQEAHQGWGAVAASWPVQMTTPAPAALVGVEASAQLHQGLADITRDGNRWAPPEVIAARVELVEVAGLLRDALGAGCARARRYEELPGELARAGLLQAPAVLLAAMDPAPHPGGLQLEGSVRLSDVANRRMVLVRPAHTSGATALARDLVGKMTSLTQALETLPLGRPRPGQSAPPWSPPRAARGSRAAPGPQVGTRRGAHLGLRR